MRALFGSNLPLLLHNLWINNVATAAQVVGWRGGASVKLEMEAQQGRCLSLVGNELSDGVWFPFAWKCIVLILLLRRLIAVYDGH
jgi:hypothetical protein